MNQIPQEGQVPNAWVRTLEELEHGHLVSGVLCSIILSYTQKPDENHRTHSTGKV